MSVRLRASVVVGALLRKAEAEGGFGAVLAMGDAEAGTVLVVLTERGAKTTLYERVLQPGGAYAWTQVVEKEEEVPQFVARRRRYDPDLWVLELDVPSRERFAADMKALD
ncbi:DUF1491 family protein [Allosphingosinicella sp.]|jgi:hypothetical protein|uniref:DUF1491 family protein n=1 Tax=Allosphingosinicella sp. TaxID=2823234 RepID=UPI002EEE6027